MKRIVETISKNWGYIYGEYTTHCHLNKEYPTTEEAVNILSQLVSTIHKSLVEEGMPISLVDSSLNSK